MLLTRCPECDTTFRVTEETLKIASGQVRCGRCASVFNAYAELQDSDAKPAEPDAARDQARSSATVPQPEARPEPPNPSPPEPVRLETKRAETEVDLGTTSVADVVAETEIAAHAAAAETRAATPAPGSEPISATEVERVLTDDVAAMPYVWLRTNEAPRSRWWTVGVALATIALPLQAMHHFRASLAGHPTFGPWVTAAYKKLGVEVAPSWDVHQYEIIDWVATAEPNERGLGSLKITARIQNHGPLRQPYPAVQLRLKDRFESRVGGRMFTPAEYLPRDTPHERLMSPGETTRAELEVVDPGPDAYGFELDVCIEVEASLVTCGTDEVFL
ncbi:MAG TPA: zinc-ribbon and DUF3426 domain-containing protein [Gammaproteobacteria bacterium]|nr:zinc-ribbon and DUF3426 domain-containing protein [Gammaproteobacteria bacterium]